MALKVFDGLTMSDMGFIRWTWSDLWELSKGHICLDAYGSLWLVATQTIHVGGNRKFECVYIHIYTLFICILAKLIYIYTHIYSYIQIYIYIIMYSVIQYQALILEPPSAFP